MFSTIKEAWPEPVHTRDFIENFTSGDVEHVNINRLPSPVNSNIKEEIIKLGPQSCNTCSTTEFFTQNLPIDEEIKKAFVVGVISLIIVNIYYKQSFN